MRLALVLSQMPLQTTAYAAPSMATTNPSFAQQVLVDNSQPGTSNAALASSQLLSAGLASAYSSQMQSFPMVPPALSVMIPTNTAGQSYHNSPVASQVCPLTIYSSCTSLFAQHASTKRLLQFDVMAMRLAQDIAFQQAVQSSHVQAAAKAAVSLLGVRPTELWLACLQYKLSCCT